MVSFAPVRGAPSRRGRARRLGQAAADAGASLAFARRHCMQRDVEIEVDAVDKAGTFLGNLYLGHPAEGGSGSQRLSSASGFCARAGEPAPVLPPGNARQRRA